MDLEALRTTALGFVEAHKSWAPLITGLLAFCESIAFLSLLVPATVILVGIGAIVGAADIALWPVVLAAGTGAGLGDWLSYAFGRHYGDSVRRMWPMRNYPDMVARGEAFLARWGAAAVALGRFVGPARAVVPLIAGTFGVRPLPFQVANWTSGYVWAFVLLAPGAGLLTWFRG